MNITNRKALALPSFSKETQHLKACGFCVGNAVYAPTKQERAISFVCVFAVVFFGLVMVLPQIAHADVFSWILSPISSLFTSAINGWFQAACGLITQITDATIVPILTRPWDSLFGANDNASVIWVNVVKPIVDGIKICASTVLSFCILVQLIQIASKMDANSTLPAVKEIFVLVIYLCIFNALIQNADIIVSGIYTALNDILQFTNEKIGAVASLDNIENITLVPDGANISLSTNLMCLIATLLFFLAAVLTYLIVLIISYARALQLYAMSIFAPISFAFLGTEHTRQWGVGFLKNFIACCLAGTILLFVVKLFPLIFMVVCGDFNTLGSIDFATFEIEPFTVLFRAIAAIVVLMFCAVKSASWARDILGG